MRKLILLAGAAAMATTMPLLAQGRGNGNGKGGGQAQAEAPGGGHGKAHGGRHGQTERGNGAQHQRAARVHAGPGRGNGNGNGQVARQARVHRGNGEARQAERRVEREQRQLVRGQERAQGRLDREARQLDQRDWNGWLAARGGGDRHFGDRIAYWREGRPLPVRVAQGGCPPGLAKQNALCLPPGQLRKAQMIGQRIAREQYGPVPEDWLYRFRDDDQSYYLYDDDGFIYRVARESNLVSTIFPLVSTGLAFGEPLPLGYEAYNLPVPYREQYIDNDEYLYRYDDNAIYRVDTETRLIEGIVALLSDSPISVGAPLPSGYDVYNLPLDYRDRFPDNDESMYRYSNGGIFQVDPQTMLVQALVEMVL